MKGFGSVAGIFLLGMAISGCSSSSNTRRTSPTAPAAEAPATTVLLINEHGLVRYNPDSGSSESIEAGIRFGGLALASPDGSETALTIKRGSSTYLGLLSADGTFREVHYQPDEASYSVAWAPTGDSLFFGFVSSDDRGVAIYSLRPGNLVDVGCRASDTALSWGSEDWFVVGDGTNHHVVERAGCATIETVDARKLHEVVFDATGQRVAYVLRELEYNREANTYRPDSSLYVASSTGSDPLLVAGDRYRPHRPSWSPDGSSLAFDARLPQDHSRRLISIYDLEDGRSAFLNPNSVEGSTSECNARWSPSGEAIAYIRATGVREVSVAVRVLSDSFSSIVGKPGEALVGWLDDDHVIVRGNGSTRVLGIDGDESLVVAASTTVLALGSVGNPGSN